ncbi:MAG: ribulose-phosphate 3-epimerase [Bacteroidia bacterium]|nr:ribulose-phosphate 3-epimerase [Bacteroidia bacterium]
MESKRILAPSILSADFTRLGEAVRTVDQSPAQWVHLDIMDGQFVPNISYGFAVVEAARRCTQKTLDAHLMIVEPDRYLSRFAKAGADIITVHYEACPHLHRTLQAIRELGVKAGVAINPHTPPELLRDVLPYADLALLMSVNPGFGGQKFIETSWGRLQRLVELVRAENPSTLIEVDGGVGVGNAQRLWEAGADALVAGNAVFGAKEPTEAIHTLLQS